MFWATLITVVCAAGSLLYQDPPIKIQSGSQTKSQTQSNSEKVETRSIGVPPALPAAQRKFRKAQREYDQTRQLVTRGSATQSQLRRGLLVKQLAELQLRAIEKPNFARNYSKKSFELKAEYAKKEYEVNRSLYQRGSISQLAYRRKLFAYKIAKVELAKSKGTLNKESSEIKVAQLELQMAEYEFRAAKRLLQTGSLKRSTYERKLEQLRAAKARVEELTLEET